MADQKPTTPGPAPAKLAPTTVEEIKPRGKKLPERYFRVTEEILPGPMAEKGLAPLRITRGISQRNAERAGIEIPKE